MRKIIRITAAILFCFTPLLVAEESAATPAVGDPVEDVGTFLDVADGLRMQLTLVDKKIIANFVDAQNKLVESPAESILFIVQDSTSPEDKWRTILKPTDKIKLVSSLDFYALPNFRAKIIIRYTDKDALTFSRTPLELTRNM
jgi:hypothetical protein